VSIRTALAVHVTRATWLGEAERHDGEGGRHVLDLEGGIECVNQQHVGMKRAGGLAELEVGV
jgi:hypothetical protein